MNNDLKIMIKVLLGIGAILFVLFYPRTVLFILAIIFFRALYIQRYNYNGFIRRIKFTFKL